MVKVFPLYLHVLIEMNNSWTLLLQAIYLALVILYITRKGYRRIHFVDCSGRQWVGSNQLQYFNMATKFRV